MTDTKQLKCAVCAVIRLENQYVREWVEYYKKLDFDKIILYDNNSLNEDKLSDVIGDYIDSGFVDVIPYAGKQCFQVKAYNDCLKKYHKSYNWIAFFDLDEFLTFTDCSTIKEYLSRFTNNEDAICFQWMIFDDNDLVYYKDKPCLERFTRPMDYNKCFQYNFPENDHIKTMVRCSPINYIWFNAGHPHACTGTKNAVLANGKKNINPTSPWKHHQLYEPAYLKHFCMKTIDEYVRFKLRRGHPDVNRMIFNKRHNIDKFFIINNHTPEKDEYVNKLKNKN